MQLDPQVVAATLGALIAGLFAFMAGWLTNRQEKQRNDRQWYREKLLESYSNCIYYLIKLSISSLNQSTSDKDVRQHFSEAQRYLTLLRAYHEEEEDIAKLKRCNKLLADNWDKTKELAKAADSAVEAVKSLLENDTRVAGKREKRERSK